MARGKDDPEEPVNGAELRTLFRPMADQDLMTQADEFHLEIQTGSACRVERVLPVFHLVSLGDDYGLLNRCTTLQGCRLIGV